MILSVIRGAIGIPLIILGVSLLLYTYYTAKSLIVSPEEIIEGFANYTQYSEKVKNITNETMPTVTNMTENLLEKAYKELPFPLNILMTLFKGFPFIVINFLYLLIMATVGLGIAWLGVKTLV